MSTNLVQSYEAMPVVGSSVAATDHAAMAEKVVWTLKKSSSPEVKAQSMRIILNDGRLYRSCR